MGIRLYSGHGEAELRKHGGRGHHANCYCQSAEDIQLELAGYAGSRIWLQSIAVTPSTQASFRQASLVAHMGR